jgi:electron transfer flavoprotein alpha subunit
MSVLVFLEHHGSELQKGALGVLGKAAALGDGEVAAVLVGGGVKALATEAGAYGATKVYVAEDESLEPPLPQPRVDVIAKIVQDGGYDTVFFANSVLAADIAAGLAARLDAGDAGEAGSKTEVLALGEPPSRGDARKIEDDGNAAQAIVDFLAEKRLV